MMRWGCERSWRRIEETIGVEREAIFFVVRVRVQGGGFFLVDVSGDGQVGVEGSRNVLTSGVACRETSFVGPGT